MADGDELAGEGRTPLEEARPEDTGAPSSAQAPAPGAASAIPGSAALGRPCPGAASASGARSAPTDSSAALGRPCPGDVRQLAPGVARVKFLFSSASEFYSLPPGLCVRPGELVVVPTRYGNEIARVLCVAESEPAPGAASAIPGSAALGRPCPGQGGPRRYSCPPEGAGEDMDVRQPACGELRPIARTAGPMDLSRLRENGVREEKAYATCRALIESRRLEMKLVSAHYLLDEQKILFLFTAENRVDFRELVRDLVQAFRMRIELRQIGVRDEARVVGGVGTCGRVLCCNGVTDRLRPVSIKMAKEQNLTLNSLKISGHCGRLLCCLAYEFDAYHEARQCLPPQNARVRYDGEEFTVVDLNVLARRVRLQAPSGRVLDVGLDALGRNPKNQAWELHLR